MTQFHLREWDRLRFGTETGQIPEPLAERLLAVAKVSPLAGSGEGGVLEHHRHHIRARGVVGVIAAPGVSLEILPKIDLPPGEAGETREAGDAAVRRRLIHMLAVTLDLRLDPGAVTGLSWQKDTLLDILIRLFADKLTEALRRGMPRRYTGLEDDLPALRGRLDVTRQFTAHAVNPARLACRFDALSEDIALNRILKATVTHLARMTGSGALRGRLRELAFVYAEIADVPPAALEWDKVVLDRTNRAWAELLAMARLFLQNRYQTTSLGRAEGTALLFEMDALFEDYIGRLIRRGVQSSGLKVTLQGGGLYCLDDAGRGLFRTKPDILIRSSGQVVQVIDTKWKRISARIEDAKQGVSQADVYQMMAYAQLYRAPRVTLLYPHHQGLATPEGVQARFTISGHPTVLETASIDVGQGAGMAARLAALVLPEAGLQG